MVKEGKLMGTIPKDPVILLSYVNTQLRDFYPSLCEMCDALGLEKESIINTLKQIDYAYDEQKNQFL